MNKSWKILVGDCRERLKDLEDESVHMIWTSPPYFGLRDYGEDDQIGLEPTPDEFVEALVEVMREAKRVLRSDGTLWLNLGDSYVGKSSAAWREGSARAANGDYRDDGHSRRNRNGVGPIEGLKPKDLIGIPWRVAFALQEDGWYLRSDIIWAKGISRQNAFTQQMIHSILKNGGSPELLQRVLQDMDLYTGNPMPESVKSRPSSAHEHIFLFSKSEKYFYDYMAAKEPSVSDHPSGNGFKREHRLSYKDENGARGNEEQWEITPHRNPRNVWCIPTKPFRGAHFATSPEALVEPCVEIGSSEGGCCYKCGTPLERVIRTVEDTGGIKNVGTGDNLQGDRKGSNPIDYDRLKIKGAGGITPQKKVFEGWEPSCECDTEEDPIPCTVLDPFMGAATTLLIADKLGRNSVGIELNPEYVEIAEKRLEDARRERFAPWHDQHIPLESEEELPDVIDFSKLFGN